MRVQRGWSDSQPGPDPRAPPWRDASLTWSANPDDLPHPPEARAGRRPAPPTRRHPHRPWPGSWATATGSRSAPPSRESVASARSNIARSRAIESGCRHGLGRGQDGGVGEHDEVAGRGCPDAWTGARGRDGPASGAWSVPVGPARCPGPRVLPHRYAAHPGGEPGPRLLRRHHRLELQRRPRRCRAAATSGSTTPPSAVANPLPLLRTVLRLRVQSDPLPNGGRSQDLMATLIG
jgi:hypothetical protein